MSRKPARCGFKSSRHPGALVDGNFHLGYPGYKLEPGDPAPDFSLPGSDGQTYRLKDLAGRPVVVAWFPKAFTGG